MFPSPGIGDIIAICTLIIKVGTVLCESREVPQEYEELSRELNALYELLQTVKNLYDPSLTAEAAIALLRIERQAKSCEDAMNEFLKNNEPPKSKTRKAVWAIRAPARAASLRQKLSTHRQMLGIFLCEFRAQQQNDTLALCRKEITVLKPVVLGITLLDAVGNRMEIPFLFCRTYELLSDTLGILFKHQELPGRSFVTRGDYQLVHGATRNIVAPTQWTFTLSPEMVVEMSMILRRRNQSDTKCPRCGTKFTGEAINSWASCSVCPGQFQIKQELESDEADMELDSPAVSPQQVIAGTVNKTVVKDTGEDWRKFRLLSIISSLEKISSNLKQADGTLGVPDDASDSSITAGFSINLEERGHGAREGPAYLAKNATDTSMQYSALDSNSASQIPPSSPVASNLANSNEKRSATLDLASDTANSLNHPKGMSIAEQLKQLQGSGMQTDVLGRKIQQPPSQNFRPQSPPVLVPSRSPTPAPRGPTPGPYTRRPSLSFVPPIPPPSPKPNGIPTTYTRPVTPPIATGTYPRQFIPVSSFGPPSPTYSASSSPEEDDIQIPHVRDHPIRSPSDFSRTFPPIDELNERETPYVFPSVPTHTPGSGKGMASPVNGVNGHDPPTDLPWKKFASAALNMERRSASTPIPITRLSGGSRPTTPAHLVASPKNDNSGLKTLPESMDLL